MQTESLSFSNTFEFCAEIITALRDTTSSDQNNPVHFGFRKELHYIDSVEVSNSKIYQSKPFNIEDFIENFFDKKFRYVSHTASFKQKKFITLDELYTTSQELKTAIEKHCLANQSLFSNILRAHRTVLKIIEQNLITFKQVCNEDNLETNTINSYIKNFSNGKFENLLNFTPCLNKSHVECKLNSLKKCITSLNPSQINLNASSAQLDLCENLISLISFSIKRLDLSVSFKIMSFTFLNASELHSKNTYAAISDLIPKKILWINRGYSLIELKGACANVIEKCNLISMKKDDEFSRLNHEISATYDLINYGLSLLGKSSNSQQWLSQDLKNYWVKIREKNNDKFDTSIINKLVNEIIK